MKNFMLIFCFFVSTHFLEADPSLRNLIEYHKDACLERLETATNEELWDIFLEGQADLFFEPEFHWISNQNWWLEAKNVLEIGSGNGAYLSKLADQFQEKIFHGIEKLPLSVKQAQERYSKAQIAFQEGDAEDLNERLLNSTEIILFRLTLQHLKNPLLALQNCWNYLSSNGYVLIIDSCDAAKQTSHPITAIDDALELIIQSQRLQNNSGNRGITLEVLNLIENQQSSLSELYEIAFTNLDVAGNTVYETLRLKGKRSRERYFNHNLLLLTLFHRTYHIPVDLNRAYKELKEYLEDENAWTILGMHYLVLKKK